MDKRTVPSGRPWNAGYSRAVRIGNQIEVSGTTASGSDGLACHVDDMRAQVTMCLDIIVDAIEQLGGDRRNVIRTRLFLTDIDRWEEAADAHRSMFAEIEPACSFVEVSRLLHPDFLVEIEATALVDGRARS